VKLLKPVLILTAVVWPVSFFLNNTAEVFFRHFVTSLLVSLAIFMANKKRNYYLLPIIISPFVDVKLLPLPMVASILSIIFDKPNRKTNVIILLISLFVFAIKLNSYFGQTIFIQDYEARQEVIRNTHLYPNILLARMFQNKAIIVANKFYTNFFSLIDVNNYFFGFAPRQLIENQNLIKFPFAAFMFFLVGLFSLPKDIKFLKIIFSALILSLSILKNFDLSDFTLWIPVTLTVYYGLVKLEKHKFTNIFFGLYLLVSLVELIRLFFI